MQSVGFGWMVFGFFVAIISIVVGLISHGFDKSYGIPFIFVCFGCFGALFGHILTRLNDE